MVVREQLGPQLGNKGMMNKEICKGLVAHLVRRSGAQLSVLETRIQSLRIAPYDIRQKMMAQG